MENLGIAIRFKASIPFSERLNTFILEKAKELKFVSGVFEEVDFSTFKQETEQNGYMKISSEYCENTIFGDPEVNIAFRAWHDATHLQLNEGFDYMAETRVAFAQIAELPREWEYERLLILTEVVAQAAYHQKTGGFVENQRLFTINTLRNGVI